MKPVKQMKVKGESVDSLVKEFSSAGVFQAGNLAKAVDIYEEILSKKAKVVFAFAGALVPGGLRNIISDLIKDGMIDLVVTTGANITHDLASAFGEQYFHCTPEKCDDAQMRKEGVSRIYDIASPDKTSIKFEKEIQVIFKGFEEGYYSSNELLNMIGKEIKDEESIVRQAYLKKVPIYVPGFCDSILGFQLWLHSQDRNLRIDPIKDLSQIHDWMYTNKERGVISLGGGVPKNYALQAALIPGPHKYAMQITTDAPQWGGLSGATLEEAISWGKLDPKGKYVTVYCDATIAFPLMISAVRQRINSKA